MVWAATMKLRVDFSTSGELFDRLFTKSESASQNTLQQYFFEASYPKETALHARHFCSLSDDGGDEVSAVAVRLFSDSTASPKDCHLSCSSLSDDGVWLGVCSQWEVCQDFEPFGNRRHLALYLIREGPDCSTCRLAVFALHVQ